MGPKFSPKVDRVSFRSSVSMIGRLCRDARMIWVVLNNNHTSKDDVSPRLFRRHYDWETSKACGSIEGAIDIFEQALRKKFFPKKNQKLKPHHNTKKQLKFHKKSERFNDFITRQKFGSDGIEQR